LKSKPELIRSYNFDLERQRPSKSPYVEIFKNGDYELYFVASEHFSSKRVDRAIDHPTFKTIAKVFSIFKPKGAILEGINTGDELSPRLQITHSIKCQAKNFKNDCAESDFTILKSQTYGTQFISGEPTHEEIKNELLRKGRTLDDILGFYLVRQIPEMKRQKDFSSRHFIETSQEKLLRYKRAMKADINFEISDFRTWYRDKVKLPLNYLDVDTNDVAPNSSPSATFLQQISNQIGKIRDEHLLLRIEKMINMYKHILVVYGGSHLLTLKPALVDLMGTPEYLGVE
jgi:hypothetical protein